MCTGFYMNLSFTLLDKTSRSGIAGLNGCCMCSFIKNCPTIFQSGIPFLHAHQQSMTVVRSSSLLAPDSVSIFISIPIGVWWYLAILILISLMNNDAEYLPRRLSIFFGDVFFKSFAYFTGSYLLFFGQVLRLCILVQVVCHTCDL